MLWVYIYRLRIVMSLGLPKSISAVSTYSMKRWLWNRMKPN